MPHSVAVPRCLSALQEVMVHLCSGEQAVVSKQAVQAGCHALLNTMGTEDVIGDAPKAADWVRLGLPVMLLCVRAYTEWGIAVATGPERTLLHGIVLCTAVFQTSVVFYLVALHLARHIRGGRVFCITSHEGLQLFPDVIVLTFDLAKHCFHVV